MVSLLLHVAPGGVRQSLVRDILLGPDYYFSMGNADVFLVQLVSHFGNFSLYTVLSRIHWMVSTHPAVQTEFDNVLTLKVSIPFCLARRWCLFGRSGTRPALIQNIIDMRKRLQSPAVSGVASIVSIQVEGFSGEGLRVRVSHE